MARVKLLVESRDALEVFAFESIQDLRLYLVEHPLQDLDGNPPDPHDLAAELKVVQDRIVAVLEARRVLANLRTNPMGRGRRA